MKRSGGQRTIPKGWRLVRLGDVLELDQPGAWGEDPTPAEPGVRVLRAADLTRDGQVKPGNAAWRRLSERDLERRLMQEGDLILERSGGGPGTPVGRVALVQGLGSVYCNNFCQQLRVDRAKCTPKYAARTLWHRYTQGVTARLEHQTTGIRNLDYAAYLNLPILLPPLPEQRAIAAVLDSIDDAIERTAAVIAATEQLRDSLLHQLLTRGVPGWHTAWKEVPGLGTMPADWDVVSLGEVVTHVGSGVTPRGGKSAYTASGITFLRSQNVHFDGLRLEDVVYVSPETDNAMARSRVLPDDVLLNITGASIGRCTVAPGYLGPANVNQHVCIIRTAEEFNPRFVWKWLSTPRSQREIDDIQTGQSRQGLNYQQVRQLTIARPSRAEQDSIVEILNGLDDTVAEAKRERDGFQLLKESTADALLMGRVRVEV